MNDRPLTGLLLLQGFIDLWSESVYPPDGSEHITEVYDRLVIIYKLILTIHVNKSFTITIFFTTGWQYAPPN